MFEALTGDDETQVDERKEKKICMGIFLPVMKKLSHLFFNTF